MKRIVVLGAAESGVGAAALAKKQGFDVFVSDMSGIKDKYKAMLDQRCIAWEEGQHTEDHKVAFSLPIGAEDTTPNKYRPSSMSYIPG